MNNQKNKTERIRISGVSIFLCFILGFILATPFKIIHKESREPLPSESRIELANRMLKVVEENNQLRTELAQLREQHSKLEETLMEREQTSTQLAETRTRYRILAGLDPVQGPGIKLMLKENPPDPTSGINTAGYFIHQEDLLNIVNELWLAGAEAIAIASRGKMERLVMRSTIRCVGSLIDVNNTRMTAPFEIHAIGNPEDLEQALTMPGGVLDPMRIFGIEAAIEKVNDLVLPAYSGSTLLKFAKPLEEGK